MAMESVYTMPLATDFDRSMAGVLSQDSELARLDQDIAEVEDRTVRQAALIALLKADGQRTIVAHAQLGAMGQCPSALRVRRKLILAGLAGAPTL